MLPKRDCLIALWMPLGFWGLVFLISAKWLFELLFARPFLFLTNIVVGALFIILSYLANVFIVKKLAVASRRTIWLVSAATTIVLNVALFILVWPYIYVIIAFMTWDGYY